MSIDSELGCLTSRPERLIAALAHANEISWSTFHRAHFSGIEARWKRAPRQFQNPDGDVFSASSVSRR